MTTAVEFKAAIDKSVVNMNRLDRLVNGGPDEMVMTDAGLIPSIAKMQQEFVGWSPVIAIEVDGERAVQKVVDWTGANPTSPKPQVTGYIGLDGLTPNIAEAINVRGLKGDPGAASGPLAIGSVQVEHISDASVEQEAITRKLGAVSRYANIAALLASPKPTGFALVTVDGYTTPGDGGGGSFYWDPSSTATVDNGIHFESADGGNGRWRRMLIGQNFTPEMWGAKGDNVTNDRAAIQAALNYVGSLGGGTLFGTCGKRYRITSGINIAAAGLVFDLNGAYLNADWTPDAPEWAVTVGDGTSVLDGLGIRNGRVTTSNTSTNLNGVIYKKNVRRRVVHDKLRVTSFKGIGIEFEELNWSIQEGFAPLIEACGTGLKIDDNGNSITIAGLGVDGCALNIQILGCVAIAFKGGYIQFATANGVLIDTSTKGAMQASSAVGFFGTYFEGNGNRHIVANNGRGLTVTGCFFNCNGMGGDAIDLNNWVGADIRGNAVSNLSGGRLFVNADSTCSLINVDYQAVTALVDTQVGGSVEGMVRAPHPLPSLPAATVLNRGALLLLSGSGTSANRSTPWMCMDVASGTRAFRRVALVHRKQGATSTASPFTPNLGQFETFDLTVPTGGLTINAPIGPYDNGDKITFHLKQGSTGGGAVTWNAVYATDLSNTDNTANRLASVTFEWNADRARWIQVGKLSWVA